MANLTREQRAAKELAEKENRETSEAPKKALMDAKEYGEKILATRKPFNGLEQKLAYEGEFPGWKLRWVNDENVPGRLDEGYIFVPRDAVKMSDSHRYGNEDTGDRVSKHAGRDEYGNPYKTNLMMIPEIVADKLNHEKSYAQIARNENSIRKGHAGGIPAGNNRVGAAGGLPEIKLS